MDVVKTGTLENNTGGGTELSKFSNKSMKNIIRGLSAKKLTLKNNMISQQILKTYEKSDKIKNIKKSGLVKRISINTKNASVMINNGKFDADAMILK